MSNRVYRNEIDGLRAIAVVAVIFFHIDILPFGYLGVDVFFVISGFLITEIIYRDILAGRFSFAKFFMRRVRRIMPLALFTCMVALAIGMLTMLPDDLENLAQSVVATNFFGNNILQAVTTRNYWDVVNEYKPLMHTWSLGVEEQYYLVYPLALVFFVKRWRSKALYVVCGLAIISLGLYLVPWFKDYQKFYLIFFRFWELAAGGAVAILLNGRLVRHGMQILALITLVLVLTVGVPLVPEEASVVAVVALTAILLGSQSGQCAVSKAILENPLATWLGKLSFSLYMWHQVFLAFARYFWVQVLDPIHITVVLSLTVISSIFSYHLIESPFRDRKRVNASRLILILGVAFFGSTLLSFYVVANAGVIRDVPELDIKVGKTKANLNSAYNHAIYEYDKSYAIDARLSVLVVGDSFARDWANVLLESKFSDAIELSYSYGIGSDPELNSRVRRAQIIFSSGYTRVDLKDAGLPLEKIWAIGIKNFGKSNGIFYNRKGSAYYRQRTKMEGGYSATNDEMRREWAGRYIDMISKVIDEDGTVPVFTPNEKFISQDCRHLTRAGAQYYAELFEDDLRGILRIEK